LRLEFATERAYLAALASLIAAIREPDARKAKVLSAELHQSTAALKASMARARAQPRPRK
jgi:hypothetical protein